MDDDKGKAPLGVYVPHEFHLMLMDVVKGEALLMGFLGFKSNPDALNHTLKVNGGFFFKVGFGDHPSIIQFNDFDGNMDFVNPGQLLGPVIVVSFQQQRLEGVTAKSVGFPDGHGGSLPFKKQYTPFRRSLASRIVRSTLRMRIRKVHILCGKDCGKLWITCGVCE